MCPARRHTRYGQCRRELQGPEMRTPHPHQQRSPSRHRPGPRLLALNRTPAPALRHAGAGAAAHARPAFTLLELMIALAILSILFASALPDLSNMLAGRQLRAASSDLLA